MLPQEPPPPPNSRTEESQQTQLHQNDGQSATHGGISWNRSLSDHVLSETTDGESSAPVTQNDSHGINDGPSTSVDQDRSMPNSARPQMIKQVQEGPMPGDPKPYHDVYNSLPTAALQGTGSPPCEGSRKPDPDSICHLGADTFDSRRPLSDFPNRQGHGSTSASTNRNDSLAHSNYGPLPITSTIPHSSSHLVFSRPTDLILPFTVPHTTSSSACSSAGSSRRGMAVPNTVHNPFTTWTGAGSFIPPPPPYIPPIDRPPRRAFAFPQDAARNPFAPPHQYVPFMSRRPPQDYFYTRNVQNPQPVRTAAGTLPPIAPLYNPFVPMNEPTRQRFACLKSVQSRPPFTTAAGTSSLRPPPYMTLMNNPFTHDTTFRPPRNEEYPSPILAAAETLLPQPFRNHPPVGTAAGASSLRPPPYVTPMNEPFTHETTFRPPQNDDYRSPYLAPAGTILPQPFRSHPPARTAAGTLPPAPPPYFLPMDRLPPASQSWGTTQSLGHPPSSSSKDWMATPACEPYIPLLKIAGYPTPQASTTQHSDTESVDRKRDRKRKSRAAPEPGVSSSSTGPEIAMKKTSRATGPKKTRDARASESTKLTENPPDQQVGGDAAAREEPLELAATQR